MADTLHAAAEVVETARGPVECARRGEAPYVVILHGTPGGHTASFMGESFEAAGFGTLTPSRPGYLRTPLATGRTFEEQADAVAALLDALAIDAVAAYAISGGGPSAIELAARHPDRVRALILEVAVSQTYKPEVSALAIKLLTSRTVLWLQGQIRGAELLRVEKGWHLLALSDGAEDCARAEVAFLREHLAPQSSPRRDDEASDAAADTPVAHSLEETRRRTE